MGARGIMIGRVLFLALVAAIGLACEADYPIWIPRSKSADPLYRFVQNGKAGYIDTAGDVVIKPSLEPYGNYGSEFHDGLLEISVSDGRYVDRTGKVVVDPGLFRGWDFSEGLAVAMRKDEKLWGFIDTTGKFAISPRFETVPNGYVNSFSDGLARIEVHGKFGYIDHTGEFVIKPEFLDAVDFADGAARVVTDGPCVYFPDGPCGAMNPHFVGGRQGQSAPCKFTYIDKKGRALSKTRFDFGRDFSEGLAPVRIEKLWGFIDKSGSLVTPPKFDDAQPYSSGLARIQEQGLYGYVDKVGVLVIPPRYKYAESFSEGFAVVGDDRDRLWYIDERGDRTIPGEFAAASPFFKGLANVRLLTSERKSGSAFAYIDTKGRRVFRY